MSKLTIVKNNIIQSLSDECLGEIVIMASEDHLSDEAIAKHFGMSKPTYYKLKKTKRFQDGFKSYGEISIRESDFRIKAKSGKAVDTLFELMDGVAPQMRLKASIEVLRLAGLGSPLPELTDQKTNNHDKALVVRLLQSISPTDGKDTTPHCPSP